MTTSALPHVADGARLAAVNATGLLDTDPEPAFDDLAGLAARLLNAPYAFVTLVDAQRSFWKARVGIPADGPVQNTAEQSFCQYVIATGEPLIAGDVTLNPLTANNPSIKDMGVRAWAGFPLMTPAGQALGSFCVVDTDVREWTEVDVETLRVLAEAAGRELAARSAAAEITVAYNRLELLAEVGHALAETLDATEAVARLAKLVVPVLGDWSLVSLTDDDGVLQDVSWWHDRDDLRPVLDSFAGMRLIGLRGDGASLDAQRTQTHVVQNSGALQQGLDVLAPGPARAAYNQLNPDVYGAWPLTAGAAVHGVLVIARDAGRPPFTADEIELAENIAQRAGIVLDNARLYSWQQAARAELQAANVRLQEMGRHDRIVSRALQDAMLTRLPEPDHLEITARYLTADATDQVGGDWYDALVPPDGATTLMIGDVSGHDIRAASLMGQLRNVLRAMAWDHDDDTPAGIVSRLDRAMPDLGLAAMTTLIVARIEQDAADRRAGLRTLRWSCAGHPAPVLLPADGPPTLLDGRPDPPLAVVRGVHRTDHVATIEPGATLLMYTDGLIERRGEHLGHRQDALLRAVEANRHRTLDGLLDSVLAELVGGDQTDDVALLAVRFHPEDGPATA